MKRLVLHIVAVTSIAATIFFTNLGSIRLWDRDEPRNAGCALEMMESGNLIVPMFNDELRYQKPVLLYWLIISAYKILGVSEFAARFWSVLCGIGTVLATYGMATRLFSRNVGLLACVIVSSSFLFVVASRAATPDSVLIFCSTMALWFYVFGTFPAGIRVSCPYYHWFPQSWKYVTGIYVFLGLGVLAKGPVGFILPMAIMGMFMLIMRQPAPTEVAQGRLRRLFDQMISAMKLFMPFHFFRTLWAMKPIVGGIIVLLVAAPWYILVGLQTNGDWPRIFFMDENFGRASIVLENHSGGFWFYPLAILLGFFPWSVFIGPTLISSRSAILQKRASSAAIIFLWCWVGVQVGLFSLASTKLPSYITPCFPALAMLTAFCLRRVVKNQKLVSISWIWASTFCLIASGVALIAGLGYVVIHFFQTELQMILVGVIPIAGGLVALLFLYKQAYQNAVIAFSASSVLMAVALFGLVAKSIDNQQQNHVLLDPIRHVSSDTSIAAFGALESSWVFYGRKPIFELLSIGDDRLEIPDRQNYWHPKPWVTPATFVNAHPNAMIITTSDRLDILRGQLGCPCEEIARCQYFLKDKQIILVKPIPHQATLNRAAAQR